MTTTDHRVERFADVDLYGVLHITADASADFVERAYKKTAVDQVNATPD